MVAADSGVIATGGSDLCCADHADMWTCYPGLYHRAKANCVFWDGHALASGLDPDGSGKLPYTYYPKYYTVYAAW